MAAMYSPTSSARPRGNLTYSASVLDTKETFAHFCTSEPGSAQAKSAFIRVAYRHRNLDLATWLDRTPQSWSGQVHKTLRRLRFCSAYSIVKATKAGAEIESTSKSCKSPHCAICSRRRSTRISKRVVAAIQDEANEKRFKGKYFYFLTLTLKHDKKVRTGVYLRELKDYTKKLYRSKLWKDQFPFTKDSMASGWITAIETTISEDFGYHIHAHVMICGNKLKMKAKKFEELIRAKWKKVTKDSFIVRFDLLNLKAEIESAKSVIEKEEAVHNVVAELIKYGTKSGNFKSWTLQKAELYADWIEKTKGANFVTCSGLFRGLELAGAKSRYDEKKEADEDKNTDPDANYLMGPTSGLKFNSGTSALSPRLRKKVLEKIKMTRAKGFQDVTEFIDELRYLQSLGFDETEKDVIYRLIDEAKELGELKKVDLMLSSEEEKKAAKQMEMFSWQRMTEFW